MCFIIFPATDLLWTREGIDGDFANDGWFLLIPLFIFKNDVGDRPAPNSVYSLDEFPGIRT